MLAVRATTPEKRADAERIMLQAGATSGPPNNRAPGAPGRARVGFGGGVYPGRGHHQIFTRFSGAR